MWFFNTFPETFQKFPENFRNWPTLKVGKLGILLERLHCKQTWMAIKPNVLSPAWTLDDYVKVGILLFLYRTNDTIRAMYIAKANGRDRALAYTIYAMLLSVSFITLTQQIAHAILISTFIYETFDKKKIVSNRFYSMLPSSYSLIRPVPLSSFSPFRQSF